MSDGLAGILRDRALARMAEGLEDAMAAARDSDWEMARSLLTEAVRDLDRARESNGKAAPQSPAQSRAKG